MSRLGHHNYVTRAAVTDRVCRQVVLSRCLEQLYADVGDEPLTPARAYDLGTEGTPWVWTRRRVVEQPPALPTDCIRPFDAGLAIDEQERASYRDDDYDWWDERQAELEWDRTDPRDCVFKAWEAAKADEWIDRFRQEELLWEIHEHGFAVPPVFASRVVETPVRGTW